MNISNQNLYNGTDWSWTETIEGRGPGDGWTLQLILKYKNNTALILTSNASGSSFLFEYSAAESALLPAGEYAYQFKHCDDTQVKVLEFGTVTIQALLSSAEDSRSDWKQVADNLMEVIKQLSTKECREVEWNNRKYSFNDLKTLRVEYHTAMKKAGLVPKRKRILEVYR